MRKRSTSFRVADDAMRPRRRLGDEVPRPCVANPHCDGTPLPDAPVRLCAKHSREMYEFCSDMVSGGWDSAVRDYVSDLHGTFKPPRAVKQPVAGWVYFIRFSDRVKIGFTTNPDQRLSGLPHDEVLGIVPGTRADEAAWHRLLADFHVTGEWFRAEPEVLAALARVVVRPA